MNFCTAAFALKNCCDPGTAPTANVILEDIVCAGALVLALGAKDADLKKDCGLSPPLESPSKDTEFGDGICPRVSFGSGCRNGFYEVFQPVQNNSFSVSESFYTIDADVRCVGCMHEAMV